MQYAASPRNLRDLAVTSLDIMPQRGWGVLLCPTRGGAGERVPYVLGRALYPPVRTPLCLYVVILHWIYWPKQALLPAKKDLELKIWFPLMISMAPNFINGATETPQEEVTYLRVSPLINDRGFLTSCATFHRTIWPIIMLLRHLLCDFFIIIISSFMIYNWHTNDLTYIYCEMVTTWSLVSIHHFLWCISWPS